MASSKRNQASGINSFNLPISKHWDFAPSLRKSPVLFNLLKRGRDDPTDGVAASPFASADTDLQPVAAARMHLQPAVAPIPPPLAKTESQATFQSPHSACDSAVKRIKFEPVEAVQSSACLKMPSCDNQQKMLLQSAEHRPILSDKDYAAAFCAAAPSLRASAAAHPGGGGAASTMPKFEEHDDELEDLKLLAGKGPAQEFSLDALMLPKAFLDLEVIFEQVLKVLATAHAKRKKNTPLDSLKGDIATTYHRSLTENHLRQITALVPQCLLVGHSWTKDGTSYYRTVCINTANLNMRPGQEVLHVQCLTDMKASLRQSMLSFLQARHSEFLQAHHPELKLNPERTSQWHADFDLGAVQLPTSELPPLPQPTAHASRPSIRDKTVEITPEILAAFEQHEAATPMPRDKKQFIRDSSKSAIGLQNIEKLRQYEISQFALQQSFKVADEKNAEVTFRSAADAIRCYFRQRSKKALPLADVLKALHLTKGLALKNDLAASDMVDRLVADLPLYFLRKKYPTHGEMVLVLSSEPFPWNPTRVYPQ